VKNLVWSPSFVHAFKRVTHRQPDLEARIEQTLQHLAEGPFHQSLHTHKLKGELAGAWACTVDYHNRILFEFAQNPESGKEEILLLTMGTHDEVY